MDQLETSARKAIKAAQEEATRQHERAERYRKALAEIAALPRPQLQGRRTWREVALEALRDA